MFAACGLTVQQAAQTAQERIQEPGEKIPNSNLITYHGALVDWEASSEISIDSS